MASRGWETSRHPRSTRRSRELRLRVLAAWPECYLGLPGCTVVSTEDDHVVPLAFGGSDEFDNHAGVCQPCHKRKTQGESLAGRRARGHRSPLRRPHPGLT